MDGDLTVVSGSSDGSGRGRLDDGPGLPTGQYGPRTYPNQLGGKQQDWVWLREREREQKQERERKQALALELVWGRMRAARLVRRRVPKLVRRQVPEPEPAPERVWEREQERLEWHLNNQGSSQLINKVMLAITGQTGIALMVAALNDHSSPFLPAFYLVVAANTVGFITAMISMLLRTRKPWASGVLAKVGAVAGSSAVILAMGMALPMRHIWAFLFLCIIVGVTVLFGQT